MSKKSSFSLARLYTKFSAFLFSLSLLFFLFSFSVSAADSYYPLSYDSSSPTLVFSGIGGSFYSNGAVIFPFSYEANGVTYLVFASPTYQASFNDSQGISFSCTGISSFGSNGLYFHSTSLSSSLSVDDSIPSFSSLDAGLVTLHHYLNNIIPPSGASSSAVSFFVSILYTLWGFMLPFGFTFGTLILVLTGIPILFWAFKRFFGG